MHHTDVLLFLLLVYFGLSAISALLRVLGPNWYGRPPTFIGSGTKAVWSTIVFFWIWIILF